MPLILLKAPAGACVLLALFSGTIARADTVTVFAAASLQEVLQRVAAAHRQAGGGRVRLVFAATSTLARQVARGAPADIFVSAHPRWSRWLAGQRHVRLLQMTTILTNRLALVAPDGSVTPRAASFTDLDLPAALKGGRLAVGDPAHVPVGLYARVALRHYGVWRRLHGHLAPTANTRAAVALVARGEAPLGIVYRSDALAEKRLRVVALIPAASHPPIRYQAALVGPPERSGRPGTPSVSARRFFDRLVKAAVAGGFTRLGFDPWRGKPASGGR
jgi:molybdate transport system substrate-binding protein